MHKIDPAREMPGIEILRFCAALAVVIVHYPYLLIDGAHSDMIAAGTLSHLPLQSFLEPIYVHGQKAVQIFWLVSGVVMMRRYGGVIGRGEISAAAFAWRRVTRLYPLHLLTLLVVIGLQWVYTHRHGAPFTFADPTPTTFIAHLLFASNWFAGQPLSFNWPIWSVSVEIVVYALFFAVLRPWAGNVLQSLVYRFAFCAFVLYALTDLATVLNPAVLTCALYFCLGCGLALLIARERWLRYAMAILALVFTVSVIAGGSLVLCAALAAAMAAILACTRIHLWLPARPLARAARLGDLTYSSYLLHMPIQIAAILAVEALGFEREIFFQPMAFLAVVAVTLAASWVAWSVVEMPVQRWLRQRFSITGAGIGRISRVKAPASAVVLTGH
jgi:peptidoglycan/LPS O-acetylase OafA/YrhL